MPIYSTPAVTSSVWAMNVAVPGGILQGIEAYRQRLWILLNTLKGDVPLQPFLGARIISNIDHNNVSAAAIIKADIINAIGLYMPELTVKKITYTLLASGIEFYIHTSYSSYTLEPLTIRFNEQSSCIVKSVIPYKVSGDYVVSLTVNNGAELVSGGFATAALMYAWVVSEWGTYGKWGKGYDNLVLYGASDVRSAVLEVIVD